MEKILNAFLTTNNLRLCEIVANEVINKIQFYQKKLSDYELRI